MLPQNVLKEGGYHVKGKTEAERQSMLSDAQELADAGAFAIVLELVMPPVAAEITARIPIPTIGIGSGDSCAGQILVTYDLVGLFPWFTPRFVKPGAECAVAIKSAAAAWMKSLGQG